MTANSLCCGSGKRFLGILLLAVAVVSLLPGCLPRVIPIQTARITQMEFFRQYYNFRDAEHAKEVFTKILGEKNIEVLLDHYAYGDAIDDLLTHQVEMQGSIIFTISLSPTNIDSFFTEGTGRYFAVRKTTNELALTGDVMIKSTLFNMNDLHRGELRIATQHYHLRYFAPGETNYANPVPIDFIVKMRTISKKDKVYSIDYDAKHPVIFEDEQIGYLEFDKTTPRDDKLIDLRGLEMVRDDYRKMFKRIREKESE